MQKVCARTVTTSKAARSLRAAVLTKNYTLRSSAKTATWSTTVKRREKRIGMLRLQPVKWLSHFQRTSTHQRKLHQRSQLQSAWRRKHRYAAAIACLATLLHRLLLAKRVSQRLLGKWNLLKLENNFLTKILSQVVAAYRFKRSRRHMMSRTI